MEAFSTKIERRGTNSIKWDQTKEVFQTDEAILPMWIADMDFPAPKEVNEAIIERARHGVYGYTFIDDQIRQNVVSWLKNRHGWSVQQESLSFSPSVITSLSIAINSFTKEGDKILIQTPVYTPFFSIIKDANREIVTNSLIYDGSRYEIDFDDLEEKMKGGVKAFVFCSPHNPVGRVWTKDELKKIADLALKYDVLILSDEIHADLVFEPNKHIPIASLSEEISDQTITFMSPTKTFNLASLQISYIVSTNTKKRVQLEKQLALQGFRMLNVMGIVGLDAAYRHGQAWLDRLLKIIEANKHYAIKRLTEETEGKVSVLDAEGTYLLWLDFKQLNMSDKELQRFLIEKAKIGLNAGSSYGVDGEQFMRMNIACPKETVAAGVDRIVHAIRDFL